MTKHECDYECNSFSKSPLFDHHTAAHEIPYLEGRPHTYLEGEIEALVQV